MMFLLEVTWWAHRALWHLIYSGVMERHPDLQFVFTEQGTAWIPDELARRARTLRARIRKEAPGYDVSTADGHSQVGSGSLPGEDLPTTLVVVRHPSLGASAFARRLRLADPPVYTRIVDDDVCLDPRTLQPGDDRDVLAILNDLKEST
jgi:seryl-tRNA(Sec) selenium transferase